MEILSPRQSLLGREDKELFPDEILRRIVVSLAQVAEDDKKKKGICEASELLPSSVASGKDPEHIALVTVVYDIHGIYVCSVRVAYELVQQISRRDLWLV